MSTVGGLYFRTTFPTAQANLGTQPEVPATPSALRGPPGPGATVSEDPDNRLTRGSDEGLFVLDDLIPDPVVYYILAKG